MSIQILIVFFSLLLLPGYFLYTLWKRNDSSRFEWLLRVLYSGGFILFIFLVGPWSWLGYFLRYLFLLLFAAAGFASYRRVQARPFFQHSPRESFRSHAGLLLEVGLLIGLLVFILPGFFFAGEPVRLAFPLKDGVYYVGQGGNNVLLNYHNASASQKYALDILELNGAGLRAQGIYPSTLERYVIFGTTIYSPCEGEVTAAVDGLPDQVPPESDTENLAGNHVAIACNGVTVLLAHMMNGSLQVQTGERVTTGQPLGQVGNSGNTSEPHLHIHAVRGRTGDVLAGEGVPLLFDGEFPVRNTIVQK